MPRGIIKRLSASILIDNEVHWRGTGPKAKRITVPAGPGTHSGYPRHCGRHHRVFVDSRRSAHCAESAISAERNRRAGSDVPKPVPQQQDWRKLVRDPKMLGGAGAGILLLLGACCVLAQAQEETARDGVTGSRAAFGRRHGRGQEHPGDASNPDTAQLSGAGNKALGPPDGIASRHASKEYSGQRRP